MSFNLREMYNRVTHPNPRTGAQDQTQASPEKLTVWNAPRQDNAVMLLTPVEQNMIRFARKAVERGENVYLETRRPDCKVMEHLLIVHDQDYRYDRGASDGKG